MIGPNTAETSPHTVSALLRATPIPAKPRKSRQNPAVAEVKTVVYRMAQIVAEGAGFELLVSVSILPSAQSETPHSAKVDPLANRPKAISQISALCGYGDKRLLRFTLTSRPSRTIIQAGSDSKAGSLRVSRRSSAPDDCKPSAFCGRRPYWPRAAHETIAPILGKPRLTPSLRSCAQHQHRQSPGKAGKIPLSPE